MPDTKQEKLSPNHWNPEKRKGLSRLENPRRKRAHPNYFLRAPCNICLLRCLIRSPQQFIQTSPAFFKLPTLRLTLGPQQRTCRQYTDKQAPLALLPSARVLPPTHLCFPQEGGFLLPKASPLGRLAPEVSRKVLNPTLPGIFKRACAGSFPAQFTPAQGSLSCAHSRTSGSSDSKLVVSSSSPPSLFNA